MAKFNFQQDKDNPLSSDEDDGWDDVENDSSLTSSSVKTEPEKKDEPNKVLSVVAPSKFKLKGGPASGNFLDQIKAQHKINDEENIDEEKIKQALETEKNRKEEQARIVREKEEAERKAEIEKINALKNGAKIEENSIESGFKQILALRKSIEGEGEGEGEGDDEDGDDW